MDAKVVEYPQRPSRNPKKQIGDVLEFVEFTNLFRSDLRTIFYRGYDKKGNPVRIQERTGEHVAQLLQVAWFVIDYFHLSLDFGIVAKKILVHDLPEAKAKGRDTPAFPNPHDPTSASRADKEDRERKARREIAKEWGYRAPNIVAEMEKYVLQHDEEDLFVCALDKFVSDMNIYLDDGYTNHYLGVTPEQKWAYKSKRIAVHPQVMQWYKQFWDLFYMNRPECFPKPEQAVVPAE